jgi:hypothetical protein
MTDTHTQCLKVWWGPVNKEIKPEIFEKLKSRVVQHFNNASKIYIFDGYAGSSPVSRQKVSVYTASSHLSLTLPFDLVGAIHFGDPVAAPLRDEHVHPPRELRRAERLRT